MSKYYVGVKIVFAWPEVKDGKEGYAVKYSDKVPDGYTSWIPRDAFEATYLPMGDSNGNTVTKEMVETFSGKPSHIETMPDGKTTLVGVKAISGFTQWDTSACVDPANYNQELGTKLALDKITSRLWAFLGFVVQWGKYGLKGNE